MRQRPHRQAAAWLAEHAGRLKLNGRIVRRSPMTMVLEAELMRAAILGKLGGWQTLEELAPELGLDPATFAALATTPGPRSRPSAASTSTPAATPSARTGTSAACPSKP